MRQSADVVIIGGGVMGCSMLYNLAKLGVTNSVLVEQDVLGSGSTGRSQAICRMHYSNPVTASMAWESLKYFSNFGEMVGGTSGFEVDAAQVRELAPMVEVDETEVMAWEPESGYADPYQLTTSYATKAKEMGARIELRNPAVGIEISGGQVQAVLTAEGRRETNVAVVASGPWSREVMAKVGIDLPVSTVRHQVAMLTRPLDRIPEHPIVGDIAQSFSFRPDSSNMTLMGFGDDEVVVGSYNEGVDMPAVTEASAKIARRMPPMADSYFRGGWSGLFTITPDWHPILDRVPGIEGLYCAVGFSGHGFKLSPMIGLTMAELITQGSASSIDINPLRFSRFEEGDLLTSSYRYHVLA